MTGCVATVRQRFTMNFSGRSPVPAIDIFSLICMAGRWQIVSVVSDITHSQDR